MNEIRVKVQTMEGDEREVETSPDLTVDEFVKELVVALRLTTTDAEGRPILWRLDNKNTGRTLKPEHTLDVNGVREGDRLSLIRATVAGGAGPDPMDRHFQAFEEGLKSFYDLFKHITTISTGSIILIITFLEKLLPILLGRDS